MPAAAAEITARIGEIAASLDRPIIVAIDGGSGAGKSTLAQAVRAQTGATLVALDDFFSVEIPEAAWAARTAGQRLAEVFDWGRVRRDALLPLRAGRPGRWQALDFAAGLRADGTYGLRPEFTEAAPAPVVLLEGAYSASAPLADLVDLAVLVDVPVAERHRRTNVRDEAAFLQGWRAIWDEVERHYFEVVRPPGTFDLVAANEPRVSGVGAGESSAACLKGRAAASGTGSGWEARRSTPK